VFYVAGDPSAGSGQAVAIEGLHITGGDAGAGQPGGGIYVLDATVAIRDDHVSGNVAADGGGLYLEQSDATLINTILADNQASSSGSGVYVHSSSADMLHATIAHNTGGDGSGIHVVGGSTVALTNTILVSHTVGISVTAGSTATLESTLWQGNGTDWSGNVAHTHDYTGDPAFVDADAGDYHVGANSAAFDRGVDTEVEEDIDGDVRPQEMAPDLGADEWFVVAPRIITYTYDPLGRLVEADYSTGESFEYAYDAIGNRKAMTVTTPLDETTVTTYTYDAANRLLVSSSPGHLVSYAWDERGNLTHDGTFTCTFNAAGRWCGRRALPPRWCIRIYRRFGLGILVGR
jgi:YD repeat-containing protein